MPKDLVIASLAPSPMLVKAQSLRGSPVSAHSVDSTAWYTTGLSVQA
jgi:hypothetical protein